MFAGIIHVHPILVFAGKVGAYQGGASNGTPLKGRLLALSKNIRLGWKYMAIVNTPAYYDTPTITITTPGSRILKNL